MITTIIFDIGNVLVYFRWKEYIASFGYSEEVNEKIAKASVLSPDWNEYDLGILTEEEILDRFAANDTEVAEQSRKVFSSLEGLLKQTEYAKAWIRDLKDKGYRVLYLSNFSQKAERECAKEMDFIPLTDGGILSWKVKMTKPDHAIYRLLADKYDLVPQECLFFDDTPVNVEAARECGFNAEVFSSYEEACQIIKKCDTLAQS